MRSLPSGWNTVLAKLGFLRGRHRRAKSSDNLRRAHCFETLEDRRVLAPVTVSNLNDVVNGNVSSIAALTASPGADGISLREAIQAANADSANDTISFSVSGTINLTATGHVGQLAIDNALTIQGSGAGSLSINAFDPDPNQIEGNGERVFDIMSTGVSPPLVQISGVKLLGADVGANSPIGSDGGAIRSAGLLTLIDCTITGNSAGRGGALFIEVTGTSLSPREVLRIENCLIEDNDAFIGGGVSIVSGIATPAINDAFVFDQATIRGNSTNQGGNGGGVDASLNGAHMTVSNSTISMNEAIGFHGGGISATFTSNASLLVTDTLIANNEAYDGGGLYAELSLGSLEVVRSTLSGNTASESGGGLRAVVFSNSTAEITDSKFIDDNTAATYGGGMALAVAPHGTATITSSTISGNHAADGGGVWANLRAHSAANEAVIAITKSRITDNDAANRGGGIFSDIGYNGLLAVEDSIISGNKAGESAQVGTAAIPNSGGGVYAFLTNASGYDPTLFTIAGTEISQNIAGEHGGGVAICAKREDSAVQMQFGIVNSTISGNRAGDTTDDHIPGTGGGLHLAIFNESFPGLTHALDTRLQNVTITGNKAGQGGGVWSVVPSFVGFENDVRLTNSIASQNVNHANVANNLFGSFNIDATVFNVIGENSSNTTWDHVTHNPHDLRNEVVADVAAHNTFTNAPGLSALGDHGGLTRTHVPLSGSPAIDSGSVSLAVEPFASPAVALTFDQRGNPYLRNVDLPVTVAGAGIVDIGAVEASLAPRIVDVVVKRTGINPWAGEHSFADKISRGEQYRPIATQGANTIEIHFDGPVGVANDPTLQAALKLAKSTRHVSDINGVPVTKVIPGNGAGISFTYSPATSTATWVFPELGDSNNLDLEDGKFALFLQSSMIAGLAGLSLDAEWDNGLPGQPAPFVTPDWYGDDGDRAFVTGDGIAGTHSGAFRLNFAFLTADYQGNGVVEFNDLILWQQYLGPGWSPADGDGDGDTDALDGSNGAPPNPQGLYQQNLGDFLVLQSIHGADVIDDEVVTVGDFAYWHMNGNFDITGDGLSNGDDLVVFQRLLGTESVWAPTYALADIWQALSVTAPAQVGAAPQVANVTISGSQSTHAAFAFTSVDGSGEQLKTVPVGGADTITITFSEDVNVMPNSLYVLGLRTGNVPAIAEYSYDAATHAATWRFEGWALGDHYMIYLKDEITDADNNFLDGEWTNPNRIYQTGSSGAYFQNAAISEFPSGDTVQGGAFVFTMTLLAGDANLDGQVNSTDLNQLLINYGATNGKLFAHGDANGDGAVNGSDLATLLANFNDNFTTINFVLADVNADGIVDDTDLTVIGDNAGMTGATHADGDLDGDGEVTEDDLDIALGQYGDWWDWYDAVA